MSSRPYHAPPPPQNDQWWVHFFSYRYLVLSIFFQKEKGDFVEDIKRSSTKNVFLSFFFTKTEFSPTSHYMIHV